MAFGLILDGLLTLPMAFAERLSARQAAPGGDGDGRASLRPSIPAAEAGVGAPPKSFGI
jgi:hypothetical protein